MIKQAGSQGWCSAVTFLVAFAAARPSRSPRRRRRRQRAACLAGGRRVKAIAAGLAMGLAAHRRRLRTGQDRFRWCRHARRASRGRRSGSSRCRLCLRSSSCSASSRMILINGSSGDVRQRIEEGSRSDGHRGHLRALEEQADAECRGDPGRGASSRPTSIVDDAQARGREDQGRASSHARTRRPRLARRRCSTPPGSTTSERSRPRRSAASPRCIDGAPASSASSAGDGSYDRRCSARSPRRRWPASRATSS